VSHEFRGSLRQPENLKPFECFASEVFLTSVGETLTLIFLNSELLPLSLTRENKAVLLLIP
jgi:hypothetical protein